MILRIALVLQLLDQKKIACSRLREILWKWLLRTREVRPSKIIQVDLIELAEPISFG
jgi:hypothetical protein